NILVRDEGFSGIVIQFSAPGFQTITVKNEVLTARSGAPLSSLVSTAARHGLGGLETLVGVPGTVGGALKNDLRIKTGPLSQFVSRVELLDNQGNISWHGRDEVPIEQLLASQDGSIIVGAEFELQTDSEQMIVKRLLKSWIHARMHQPLAMERSSRL